MSSRRVRGVLTTVPIERATARGSASTFGHALEHRRQEFRTLPEELVDIKLHAAKVV